jgi:two-component system sensor histidine kinase SenX3
MPSTTPSTTPRPHPPGDREHDGWLELRVEDNGPGFPPPCWKAGARRARQAASNFLTNSTGLGLYFSSEVAKMHRHRGAAAAAPGKRRPRGGGCFILNLP